MNGLLDQIKSEIKRINLAKSEILEDAGVTHYLQLLEKSDISDYEIASAQVEQLSIMHTKVWELGIDFLDMKRKFRI
jgi:hypothetical protein